MKARLAVILICTLGPAVAAQERPVPKDSQRVSIPGCAKERRFIVAERPGHEPVRSDIKPGRRFRLNGPRALLAEIRKQDGTMIEVTGLVKRSDLGERGISVGGGVRVGGGVPRAPMGGGPGTGLEGVYAEAIIDVESWRPLPEACPSR